MAGTDAPSAPLLPCVSRGVDALPACWEWALAGLDELPRPLSPWAPPPAVAPAVVPLLSGDAAFGAASCCAVAPAELDTSPLPSCVVGCAAVCAVALPLGCEVESALVALVVEFVDAVVSPESSGLCVFVALDVCPTSPLGWSSPAAGDVPVLPFAVVSEVEALSGTESLPVVLESCGLDWFVDAYWSSYA